MNNPAFRKVLRRFYADFRGKKATFVDFRKTSEAVAGKDLRQLFDDWVTHLVSLIVSRQLRNHWKLMWPKTADLTEAAFRPMRWR